MKKKFLLQIMGAVMVAGLMTGCGAKSGTSNEQKTETTTESAESKETEESTEADTVEDTEQADTADAGEATKAEEADTEEADTTDTEADATDTDEEVADAEEDTESDTDEASEEAEKTADAGEESDTAKVQSTGTEAAADADETDAAGADASTEDFVFTNTDPVTAAGWTITLEDVEKNPSLENVSVQLGYTGVETSDYQKEAEAGKTFCLIKMAIKKDGSKETFQWDNLKLTDGSGNEYTRMEDEFLTDLGMTRMPGTALNFGSNEGWIAFEIDENATDLVLSYQFASEEYSCELK